MASIQSFLYPKSIAIIGASKDPTKRGFRAIQTLLAEKFAGAIYPVNPKEPEILGVKCYPALADIPAAVDLALICTPARTLPDLMRLCGEKGIGGAVVLAGGFGETGDAGRELQAQMVAAAKRAMVRVIGPNTSGIFNTHARCNLVGYSNLKQGGIALLSQSGNMALSLVTEGEANGHIGFSTYIGIGNEADIQFHEYLDYCGDDANTNTVIAYVEGLKQGRAFLDVIRRVTAKKPVVVFKSGRTNAGQSSAKSHTGALAGDYAVSEGALRQAGAVLVRNSDQLLPVAEALSLLEPLRSRRVAVLADGGGHATITADVLTEHGLTLATLSDRTRERLAALLPASAALANPVDVAGGTDSNPAVFADCARIMMEDESVDALLIAGLYGGYGIRFSETLTAIELDTSDRIAALHRELKKPVLVYSLYAGLRPAPLTRLREAGVPIYASLETAARCLLALAEYGESRRRALSVTEAVLPKRLPGFETVLSACRRDGRSVVLEHEARQTLAEAGLPMAPMRLVHSAEGAEAAFNAFGSVPIALKIVSQDIIHKSDAGGVKLNLADGAAVRNAFAKILENGMIAVPEADIAGVLVTPMAAGGGVEVIIGVVRDPQYGPVLMFGLGGILVEVLKDVVFRTLPMTRADAQSMIEGLRAKEILNGVRGAAPVDKAALVDLMMAVSDFCIAYPEIEELDLNPVLSYPNGFSVLDARILLTGDRARLDTPLSALPEEIA